MINEGDIAERIIQAVEIFDAATAGSGGPKKAKSMSLPTIHTVADKNGWGSERLAEDRKEFFENLARRPSARQLTDAEEAIGWFSLVENDNNRASLAAWAECMSDASRRFFKDWCAREGIQPITGTRRKNRAISEIHARLRGKVLLNNEIEDLKVLPDTGKSGHKVVNIRDRADERKNRHFYRDDLAFQAIEQPELRDFSWAEARNKRRREREARQREARQKRTA